MSDSTRRTRGVQQGPRSRRVVESVREATLAELARVGFAGLTIDGVAKAAGVHRTTLYRRWPTKADLVASAMEPLLAPYAEVPETGSLEGDLLALMRTLTELLNRPDARELTRAVASNTHELREVGQASQARALGAFEAAFERARQRGELREDADVEMMVHLVFYGLVYWVRQDREPEEADRRRLLQVVLAGARRPGAPAER